MKNRIYFVLAFIIFGVSTTPLTAQKITEQDYQNAVGFMRDSLYSKTYHLSVSPMWFEDHSGFAYKVNAAEGERYYTMLFNEKSKKESFDEIRFGIALSSVDGDKIETDRLPISNLKWNSENSLNFKYKNKNYKISLENYKIEKLEDKEEKEQISPDENYSVFINNSNLFLKNLKTNHQKQLSTDGSPYYIYGSEYGWYQTMKGESTPPEPNLTASWSPNSKKILTQIMDARNADKMYLLNWSIDSLYRPELLSYYRGSPADTNIMYYLPVIFDRDKAEMIKIDLPPVPHFTGLDLKWTKDSEKLYGLYYHRGYKKMDLIEINANSGKVRVVYTDESDTNIEYKTQLYFAEKENIAFVTSEKTGWNQLYKVDWKTGKTNQFHPGEYVVLEIKAVDELNKEIYFTASAVENGINPYYQFLYKTDFNGKKLVKLTAEPVDHQVFVSKDFKYFIDNRSTPNQPTISTLRSTKDGKIISEIGRSDFSELTKKGWKTPEIISTTARDGKTEIFAAIWKPTHFDSSKKYPVIDYTYTGPHTQVVPFNFSKVIWTYAYNDIQALAELGFIVVQIDGLGSAGRSKIFRDWSYGKLGDNLKDHELMIKYIGEKYSWADTERVGIFGHSAGGYDAAHALLTLNETYKVGVSMAADHDWRMEKAWWPEMYAGWPVGDYYDEQSNVTLAPNLKGNLLLMHGGIDENVNPSATFKLSEALIKAGKYFDMLIIPSARHGIPKEYEIYVSRKKWDYFLKHLKAE